MTPPPKDLRHAAEIQRASLADEMRMIAGAEPDSRLYQRHGITATIVPAAPQQPIANMIAYDHDLSSSFVVGLPEIERAYRAAGVSAWTVWVPDWDDDVRAAVRAAGYRLAARLPAIVMDLATFLPPDLRRLDHDTKCDMAALGRVNQAAHASGAGLAAALAVDPPRIPVHLHRARLYDGTAAVVAAIDHAVGDTRDCGVYFGATLPAARGLGLGKGVVAAALRAAQRRGCATASGQASEMGAPVWAKLGFETVFHYETYALPDEQEAHDGR